MVYGDEVITLSIDKRDEPFNILIRHARDFSFVVNRKQCYLNGVIIMLDDIKSNDTGSSAFPLSLRSDGHAQ